MNDPSATPSASGEAPAGQAAPASPPPSPPASGELPAISIPDGFAYAKDGAIDFEALQRDLGEYAALKDGATKAAEGVPEAADGYALNVSEDWKYADGSPQELKADDPLWEQFRAWAHEHRVPQEGLDKLVEMYAAANRAQRDEDLSVKSAAAAEAEKAQALELAKLADPSETDDAKIVAQVEQRTQAVDAWLTSVFGEKGAAVAMQLKSAAAVEVFEALKAATADVQIGGAKPNGEGAQPDNILQRWYGNGAGAS